MYGSDRAFVDCVNALRSAYPEAETEIILPYRGALEEELSNRGFRVSFENLFVVRRARFLRLLLSAPFSFPASVWRAIHRLAAVDVVYVNTSVVLDYLVAARWARKAIVHIHEIPEALTLRIIRAFLVFSRAALIFNSCSSRDAFALCAGRRQVSVVYNSVELPAAASPIAFSPGKQLKILLIGRINAWKGQDLLLDALSLLPQDRRGSVVARIVGGTFATNVALEDALRARIWDSGLQDVVSMEPFQKDTAPLYEWADVVAVPSRKPEPFGRVAIEAMSFGRPVMASAMGGIKEIVVDRSTGWLFPPNDASALFALLLEILNGRYDVAYMGKKAFDRCSELFTSSRVDEAFLDFVRSVVDSKG